VTVNPQKLELEGTDADLSILLGDDSGGGGATTPPAAAPATVTAEGQPVPPTYATAADVSALREENERLRQQNENFQMTVLAKLGDAMQTRRSPEPPSVPPAGTGPASPDDIRLAMDYAIKNDPSLIPTILERVNGPKFEKGFQDVENRVMAKLDSRDAASVLRNTLQKSYGDDVSDPTSPIIRQTPQMKIVVRNLLRGHIPDDRLDAFVNGESGEQLAYLLSAATQPNVVAKREAERARLDESRRNERVARLTQLTGMGSGSTGRSAEPTWTDKDEELLDEFADSMVGVNKKDPAWREKAKAKILARKKTVEFPMMDSGMLIGGER